MAQGSGSKRLEAGSSGHHHCFWDSWHLEVGQGLSVTLIDRSFLVGCRGPGNHLDVTPGKWRS